ncbi:MAG TPA: hypothetical protein VGM72_05130 [Micropepsaceae bacterium]|jgi:hypothetical protein
MAEIRENYMPKERGFGGKMGSKKTLWVAIVVIIAAAAVGAFYMFPQFW